MRAHPKPELQRLFKGGCAPRPSEVEGPRGNAGRFSPAPPSAGGRETARRAPSASTPGCSHRGPRGGDRKALGGSVGSPGRAARTPSLLCAGRAGGAHARCCPRGNGGRLQPSAPPTRSAKGEYDAGAGWPGARRAAGHGLGGGTGARHGPRPGAPLPARPATPRPLTAAFVVRAQFVLGEAPVRVRLRVARHPPGRPEQQQPEEQPGRRSHVVVAAGSR